MKFHRRLLPAGSAVLAAALLLAACGDGPAAAPAPPVSIPGSQASKVAWDPEFLAGTPGEFVAEPGSGNTFLEGTVVDEEGKPVPAASVEVHALPRGVPFLAPRLHARAVSGPDGSFRVGPGPTPWWSQGVLSAYAPGFARASLVSRSISFSISKEVFAEEGHPCRLVLRRGYAVKGQIRAKDGGPPDGPVTIRATGPDGFFEVCEADAAGVFQFTSPPGRITVSTIEGVHPGTSASVDVAPDAENRVAVQVARGRDIRGRVVDGATGKPVAGAVLRAYYGITRLVRTGPDGEFVLPKFWFRAFQVRAPGYAVQTHYLPDDAGAPGVAAETIRLPPGFVARGRVLDLDGRPVAGARLRILTREFGGERVITAGPCTGPDGSFVFVGLPLPAPGHEIRVFAIAEESAWAASSALAGTAGSIVEGVEVRLPRLVDLAGRVEDGAGAPVAAAIDVKWDLPKDLAPYGDVVQDGGFTRAAEDGAWRIRVPERTSFRIVARSNRFSEARTEGTSPAASGSKGGAIPVVIKVDLGLSIRGTVEDAGGNPVRRGRVRAEPRPPTDPRPSRDADIGPDGTFEAGALTAGAYDFSVVVLPEFLQEVVRDVQAGGPPVKVVLRRPGGLRFHVVVPDDVPEGTEPEVQVRALEDTPIYKEVTAKLDTRDPVSTIGPLAPVAYTVAITVGDYRADFERIVVLQREPTDLGDVVLKPAGVVTGKVTVSGVPQPGAAVEVLRRLPGGTARFVKRVTTSRSGVFRVGALLPGSHILTVRCPDRPFLDTSFDAVTGEVTNLDIPLAQGGTLRVTVRDAAGRPVPGARILFLRGGAIIPVWKEGVAAPGPQETGPDGTLRCTGLPAGEIQVRAEKPGGGSGETAATVADGGAGDVEIRFGK